MRPSWQLDLKWLAAIAAVALVFATSVSYTLYRLTEHDTATGAFTAIAVTMLEDKVDEGEWQSIRAEAAANPEAEYYVPGVNVTVTGAEIAESTLPQALDLVVGRVADTLYYEGSGAAAPLFAEEPKEGARALGGEPGAPPVEGGEARSLDPGPFAILSQDSHDFFKPLVFAFAAIALLPLAALALFCRRFGRLGSPAAAVLTGVAPAALLSTIASRAASGVGDEPGGLGGRLGEAISPVLGDLSTAFLIVAAAAGTVVALAVLGHAGAWLFAEQREVSDERPPEESDELEAPALPEPVERPSTYISDHGFAGYDPAARGSLGAGGFPTPSP